MSISNSLELAIRGTDRPRGGYRVEGERALITSLDHKCSRCDRRTIGLPVDIALGHDGLVFIYCPQCVANAARVAEVREFRAK